ncbi:MAG: hypothetical protein IBV52_09575 [Candidatus Bathyarchaeota archaeon]
MRPDIIVLLDSKENKSEHMTQTNIKKNKPRKIMASSFTVCFPSVSVFPVVYVFAVSSIHAKDCFLVGVFPGFSKTFHLSEKIMFFQEYNIYVF